MLFSETYQEIKSSSKGLYKERNSKFIAYAYPVYSRKEIKDKINRIKKKEHAARHYCYAYVLNIDKSEKKMNDDGEPSSTAGKPILGQIDSNNLTNILIIVVRYFGGVKLGISGLIRSYKNAAKEAIKNAIIINKTIKEQYQVDFQQIHINTVMRLIKRFDLEILETSFNINCRIIFSSTRSKSDQVIAAFKKQYQLKIKYIKTK